MLDPFLSDPSRKRKRVERQAKPIDRHAKNIKTHKNKQRNQKGSNVDEDADGSEESETASEVDEDRADSDLSSDEEFADENAADKRRRLAKQYLENLKTSEVTDDFDAQDLDDDNVSRRLQIDVAENKGFIYKFLGDKISPQLEAVTTVHNRIGSKNMTGLSIKYPHLYTVSKDMELIKWAIDTKKPKRIKHIRGGSKYSVLNKNVSLNHHFGAINCVAALPDGKYVITGGSDARLIIWSSENLACLKVLETRSAVNAITFKRNSDQLYAACADLRIRTYSINQFTQLEILYGHQDNIVDISSLLRDTCVSVGLRDKTAMFWKISEELRLTFRGGDSTEKKRKKRRSKDEDPFQDEGSIEVVSMLDESKFVTGSDNGNLALWSLAKKKALFTQRLSHGLQPEYTPLQASSEVNVEDSTRQIPEQQAHWITSLHAVPFSDVFISGSFDGTIKIWQIPQDGFRYFKLIGTVGGVKGCVVKIETVEVEKKLLVFVLTSKEHKFGRWLNIGGRNGMVSFSLDI